MKRLLTIFAAGGVLAFCGCSLLNPDDNTPHPTQQALSGTISQPTSWSDSNATYHITGHLDVQSTLTIGRKAQVLVDQNVAIDVNTNGSLIIHEGAVLRFNSGAYIEVGYSSTGSLQAVGSDSLPVWFTAAQTGQYWGYDGTTKGGILIYENTTANATMQYCIVEKATAGIYVDEVKPVISNCKIRNCQKNGVYFSGAASPKDSASFLNDTISSCGEYPIYISSQGAGNLSGSGLFSQNAAGKDAIYIKGSDVTSACIWKKHTVPYILSGQTDVGDPAGVTLTIRPGVVCKFEQDAYIQVGYSSTATLIAQGTVQDSIRFVNAVAATKWGYDGTGKGGILLYPSSTLNTSLKYCVIDSATQGVYCDAKVEISNCSFRNNTACGIFFDSDGSPKDSASFLNNIATGNGDYGVRLEATYLTNLSGTGSFVGNAKGGFLVHGNDVAVSGRWKKHDAPYVVSGQVDVFAASGVTITIQPGARFELLAEAYFQVGYNGPATVIANGAQTDSIVFTSSIPGTYWGYDGTSKGGWYIGEQATTLTALTYCVVEKATSGFYIEAPITINNCSIRNNRDYGIEYGKTGLAANISNNSITGNGTGPTVGP